MRWLRKSNIKDCDGVEYLTYRADTQYDRLYVNGLVHTLTNPETGVVTAWILKAVYHCTLEMSDGQLIHIYSDAHGLFGVDGRGFVVNGVKLSEPFIHRP